MKFKTLKIRNFGTIEDLSIDLDDQGLVLILGRNEDAPQACSNGAGKSLLLDAFTWVLWGHTVRGLAHDDVINDSTGSNCNVTLTLQVDSQDYTISRFRKQTNNPSYKPNDLVLLANGQDVSGTSVQNTQDIIDTIIGIDFTSFCALMPGAKVKVSEMTDSQIKDLLERLLQTQVFSQAYRLTNEEYKKIQQDYTLLQRESAQITEWLTQLETERSSIGRNIAQFEADRKEKITTLRGSLDSVAIQAAKCEKDIKAGKVASDEKDKLTKELNGLHVTIKQKCQEHDALHSTFKCNMDRVNKEIQEYKLLIKHLDSRKKRLVELGPQCPSCDQNVDAHYLSSSLQDIEAQRAKYCERITDLESEATVIEAELHTRVNPIIVQMKEYNKEESALEDQLTALGVTVQLAVEAQRVLSSVDSHRAHLRQQIKDVEQDPNPFEGLVDIIDKKLEGYSSDKTRVDAQVKLQESQLALHKFWLEGFSPGGLRSFMLEHVTPILNASAKKYADLLTGGEMTVMFDTKKDTKKGSVKESFNIKVSQKHGGSSYTANSAGERSRVNLVVALALGDLVAMRSRKKIPFRFFDEPFENIDESGAEAVVKLLNEQKDLYETIFVITHQDYFKQMFSNKITIVKSNKVSYLAGKD